MLLTISKIAPLIDVFDMENITELEPSMKPSSGVKQEGYFLNADMRAKEITLSRRSQTRLPVHWHLTLLFAPYVIDN